MDRKVHLIMPMAGAGTRFSLEGYERPKPLLELWGRPFFFWAAQSVARSIPLASLTFVVLRDHVERFGIDQDIRLYYPEARIVTIPRVLPGAALSCLEGIRELPDDGLPVLFNDCSHCFSASDLAAVLSSEEPLPDGALLCYYSTNPSNCYLLYDLDGRVACTAEGRLVSQDAVCGAYLFADKKTFARYAARYLSLCEYDEFFVSGIYNLMIEEGCNVQGYPVDCYIPLHSPVEYQMARNNDRSALWL